MSKLKCQIRISRIDTKKKETEYSPQRRSPDKRRRGQGEREEDQE